ncbi:MAG: hypothetical protein WA459_02700 [Stellaceae bacterium]
MIPLGTVTLEDTALFLNLTLGIAVRVERDWYGKAALREHDEAPAAVANANGNPGRRNWTSRQAR